MAYYIRQLKDNQGNIILPASRAEGVYFHDNTTLDSIMSSQAGVVAKALGDKNGKDITGYVTNLTSKGTVVTFTKGDGSKGTFNTQDTTYDAATGSKAGLMSAADKAKLDGIAPNANNYTHPSHTAAAAGLYKVTVDALGHVTATTRLLSLTSPVWAFLLRIQPTMPSRVLLLLLLVEPVWFRLLLRVIRLSS